ncbi:MAG: phosphoglycerate mutase family protein [Planctomycetota bacterium]|nr:phosphoglycerate mutase family protein [Planctomycetota bacterium]
MSKLLSTKSMRRIALALGLQAGSDGRALGTYMRHITLIRHGESLAQINQEESGVNPDLSPNGEQQAIHLKGRTHELSPDVILVSPLLRAYRTYQLSGLSAPSIQVDPRLVESDWGIDGFYDGLDCSYLEDGEGIAAQVGRHINARERACSLIDSIIHSEHERYVLIGHWGIFNELFHAFVGLRTSSNTVTLTENTALSQLEINDEGKRLIHSWNDASHLRQRAEESGARRDGLG